MNGDFLEYIIIHGEGFCNVKVLECYWEFYKTWKQKIKGVSLGFFNLETH